MYDKKVSIHPHGKRGDRGEPAGKDNRATPKNWGRRKVVGVISNGVYIDARTGLPVSLKDKGIPDRVRISKLGGKE